ncbi:EAL domain-containing protein [Eubacteriales bacterium OttesenSCG-928-K08]|nr:EAL domain-containing protein [Eubacteriales bacterium OttesenSCG-928-K08]
MSSDLSNRLINLYEELNIAVMVISCSDGEILFSNKYVLDTLDMDPKSFMGSCYKDIFEPEFALLYNSLVKECADGETHMQVFFWENRLIWEQVSAKRISWINNEQAILLNITNITDVCRSEFEYKRMAYYDRLLHLPNGQKLEADIATISNADRAALINFDIERFSSINDLYGWDAGDELLMQVRDWLLSTLRKTSRLYRTNDNEFCLLIRDISLEDAKSRATEIINRFSQPWELNFNETTVNVYCTIEMSIVHGKYVCNDIRNMLYRTTHSPGQDTAGYSMYNEEMDMHIRKVLLMRHDLVNCIKDGMRGFDVHYQPIVDSRTEQWVGVEALCRWQSSQGEHMPPSFFIPEAEKLGFIGHLDRWVRETALAQCVEWKLHERQFFLDLNFSPTLSVSKDFTEDLLASLERHGYPKNKLTLEITESSKMNFSEDNLTSLQLLHEGGITLALDDFGTGYSSLENLGRIPVKVLKLERLFTQAIDHDSYFRDIIRLVSDFVHTIDKILIAEGVETDMQRCLLRSYNIDYFQGYFYSKPLTSQEFAKHLHKFSS